MLLAEIQRLREFYRRELVDDTLPFWLNHGLDHEHGGLLDFLARDGSPLSTDKGGWIQGRFTWVLARCWNELEKRPQWLAAARNCADFVRDKVLSGPGGRGYFEVTREGHPLVLRRYLFSELFAVLGLAEFSRASGEGSYLAAAHKTLELFHATRGTLEPKLDPKVRSLRGHSETMMLIHVYQILRDVEPQRAGEYTGLIDQQIDELKRYFYRPDLRAILETVNSDGSLAEGTEGRCLNPGHGTETAWFLLEEARWRGESDLVGMGLDILQWSLERGWDPVHGGLFSFVDLEGKQPAQVEWDMKYWWPHCEATYAALLAYHLTGDGKWERWFGTLHDWTWKHFPDPVHGEWFGYLHRDGTVANDVKGNHYKGAFHVPRFQLNTVLLLDKMASS
ncbi:MAG: AGE family epimerase/isomerase [Spirochaetales bacterium]